MQVPFTLTLEYDDHNYFVAGEVFAKVLCSSRMYSIVFVCFACIVLMRLLNFNQLCFVVRASSCLFNFFSAKPIVSRHPQIMLCEHFIGHVRLLHLFNSFSVRRDSAHMNCILFGYAELSGMLRTTSHIYFV